MTIDAFPPSPQTTLVILLGASEWPDYPLFQASGAFTNAAQRFKDYLLAPQQFALPPENLLDLFDSTKSADETDQAIGTFLEQRTGALKAMDTPARDVLLYFVGHGGFIGSNQDYFLAARRTRVDNPRVSGIQIVALADTIKKKARHLRHFIILDCCYAAAAFGAFQSDPSQVAIVKTIDAFEVKKKGEGFPRKGVALLCSSDQKTPSLLMPDNSCTIFSDALLNALATGNRFQQGFLSLRDVRELAEDILRDLPIQDQDVLQPPRPVVHSPDQSEGDVAEVPFFPNPAVKAQAVLPLESSPETDTPVSPQLQEDSPRGQDALSDEQTIYISPEDDLAHIIERVKQIEGRQVALIVSKTTLLRNVADWKMLRARTRGLQKNVQVISPDPRIRSAASAANFRVAGRRTPGRIPKNRISRSEPREDSDNSLQISPLTTDQKSEKLPPPSEPEVALPTGSSESATSPPITNPDITDQEIETSPIDLEPEESSSITPLPLRSLSNDKIRKEANIQTERGEEMPKILRAREVRKLASLYPGRGIMADEDEEEEIPLQRASSDPPTSQPRSMSLPIQLARQRSSNEAASLQRASSSPPASQHNSDVDFAPLIGYGLVLLLVGAIIWAIIFAIQNIHSNSLPIGPLVTIGLATGLITSTLTSALMRGGGCGCIGDWLAGSVGSSVGALLTFPLNWSLWRWVAAFIGACIMIAVLRSTLGRGRRSL